MGANLRDGRLHLLVSLAATGCARQIAPVDAAMDANVDVGADTAVTFDAVFDAYDDAAEASLPSRCEFVPGSTDGWASLECGLSHCDVRTALDPATQSQPFTWLPCGDAGASTCQYIPAYFRSVIGRQTDHGPLLWVERSVGGFDNLSTVWELRSPDGPAIAMYHVDSHRAQFVDGGPVYECDVRARSVGTVASGIEFGDATVNRGVFVRGPNTADPAWQRVYAFKDRGDIEVGGTLAVTANDLYLGVNTRGLFRIGAGAVPEVLLDPKYSWWGFAPAPLEISALSTAVFYMAPLVNAGPDMGIRAIVDGQQPVTVNTIHHFADVGRTYEYGLAATESTVAWITEQELDQRAQLWQAAISTAPDGVIPSYVADVPVYGGRDYPNGLGTDYYAGSSAAGQAPRTIVVRLRDGAQFRLPDLPQFGYGSVLWMGPDELGFTSGAFDPSNQQGTFMVYRVPYSALVPM